MADSITSSEQSLIRGMGLNEANIDRRKKIVGLDAGDVARIRGLREAVATSADALANGFFEHLSGLDEARGLFASRDLLEQARALKRDHLVSMVAGEYGMAYVEGRIRTGLVYGRAGITTGVFLAAFRSLLGQIGARVVAAGPGDSFEAFMSLTKVSFFDIGIITDVLVYERERTIRQQSEAIRELSTPVLQIRDRLLLLPIIGVIDTHRAQLITQSLLRAIRTNRARVVVMDVTGVATIDSKVANHLLQTVSAAKLMGAHVVVSGLSADVAQSLVTLGIEVNRFNTVGDLQSGVEVAERLLV